MNNSDIILFFTLLAVLWYAWEAKRTANKMEEQNELHLLPYFNISINFIGSKMGMEQTHLTNIGKGIALNINFNNVSQHSFPTIPILRPGEGHLLTEHDWFISLIENKTHDYEVTVLFDNIKGQRYSQKIIRKDFLIKPQKIVRAN